MVRQDCQVIRRITAVMTVARTSRVAATAMGEGLYTGGCMCGEVRFEARAEPYRVGICHCLDCRKHSGSLFAAFAVFPEAAVTVTGAASEYEGRFFCTKCGSSVFARSGDEIELQLGALDAPNQLRPSYELWTGRRENWLPEFPVTRRYEGNREGRGPSEA